MTIRKIGVIIGSTRPNRVGGTVGSWVADQVRRADNVPGEPGIAVDLIDLAEVGLPFMDEPREAATGIYQHEHTLAWARRVRALDGVILVTSEYNGSLPAPLKNALDFLGPEWADLPTAIVAYGNSSSGARAITALLPVMTQLAMIPAGSVLLGLRARLTEAGVAFTADDEAGLASLIDRLLRITIADGARSRDPRRNRESVDDPGNNSAEELLLADRRELPIAH